MLNQLRLSYPVLSLLIIHGAGLEPPCPPSRVHIRPTCLLGLLTSALSSGRSTAHDRRDTAQWPAGLASGKEIP